MWPCRFNVNLLKNIQIIGTLIAGSILCVIKAQSGVRLFNVAIILAGGEGKRASFSQPKQLVSLAGKPVIQHTLETFIDSELFDFIVVACGAETKVTVSKLKSQYKWSSIHFADAGAERWKSTLSGAIKAQNLTNSADAKVLIHDAVRPLVSKDILINCINKLDLYDAIDVAIPATDTIIEIDADDKIINQIPDRRKLYNGQTPQGFKLVQLRYFLETAISLNLDATDDCGMALQVNPNLKIGLVEGEATNLKLTYEQDLYYMDKLIQIQTKTTEGLKEYFELGGKNIVIIGGTRGIGAAIADELNSIGAYPIILGTSTGFDVSSPEIVEEKFNQLIEQNIEIFAVINCAAVLDFEWLENLDDKKIDNAIDINLKGAIYCSKYSIPLLEKTWGSLIHFTSSSYSRGREQYAVYSASKAGIVNLTQALSEEFSSKNIRVNCICPGRTNTDMRKKAFGNEDENSLLPPNDVAKATVRLLQSKANGQIIEVRKGKLQT